MPDNIKNKSINGSLSARLLWLTFVFILSAEILIYVPSIATFREDWLKGKLAEANIAILVVEAAPDYMVSRLLTDELLSATHTYSISRINDDINLQLLSSIEELDIKARFDLRDASIWSNIKEAFISMSHIHNHEYLIEVTGQGRGGPDDEIIFIFNEDLLSHDMYIYSRNVGLLTIIISLFTAMLVYYNLSNLLVRPVKKIIDNMISFRAAPEDLTKRINPEDRNDEIGVVMNELANMQDEIRKALNQQNHLAKLGGAISNINHDLRNMLASVQLVSDHLASIDNPIVQKLAPRFVKSLDRAIRLCENTLQYGGSATETPIMLPLNIGQLVDEISISLGLLEDSNIKFINNVAENMIVNADNDQIFRVIMNICRNAVQILKDQGHITVNSRKKDDKLIIDIIDDGPGIPDKIKETLFQPFKSGSQGGVGLGLAISQEIIMAHGGNLELVQTSDKGSVFRFTLPLL